MATAPPRPTAATAADRLDAAYWSAGRLPAEVAGWAARPDTLAPGSPAKVGILDLAFAVRAGRTELVERYQKTPLQIMRPLWIDPARPDAAHVYLMATGGGVTQADRYRIDVRCGPGTRVHLTTQAATKVFRMEQDYASQLVHLEAAPGAYLEYLPDPLIPFRDSRFYQRTTVTAAPGSTVVLGETITAGRLARDERHDYRVLATDLEIVRPDGTPLAVDTLRLTPGGDRRTVTGPAVFAGHDHLATLFVVSDLRPAAEIADTLHRALDGRGLRYGVSTLPEDAGAWLRLLEDSPVRTAAALADAWRAVRLLLTGIPAPALRKT
ncbi:urease accessory protein [Kitasatospora sp. SolWspMP-SS2h]|uniref:urease accessory protein UreD n=1 Tax=Kitasatospora sp. SolWspMP-SS2h TaxID=1305729 RepID=UPI000DBA03F0|nr:urease accessory protein UreD [Kitasatospora sp. SolWspMP-SS2h]RAJ31999.1 urease accessory protein [Kitasatospora sp. SolWspMP-SS2h]